MKSSKPSVMSWLSSNNIKSQLLSSCYALRNRCLRYGKRCRYWAFGNRTQPIGFQKINKYQIPSSWRFPLILFIITAILVICRLFFRLPEISFYEPSNSYEFQNNHMNRTDESYRISGMIKNENDHQKKLNGFRLYSFNSLVSERLGYYRPWLPDTRHKLCKLNNDSTVDHGLLNTTVIICFFNEEFHTLIRTVNSVLHRTPSNLLHEILLIDDFSDENEDVRLKLEHYMQNVSFGIHFDFRNKVQYHRLPERSGLIRSRNYGVQKAHGQVLFFLDSHCEVNVGWLPPILERINRNPKTIACPIIDLIDPDTFLYKPSPMVKGGFNWALHFKWDTIPHEDLEDSEDFVKPIKSPAMAGGLFAITRDYFHHLGAYDSGMNIWGAENIEFSLRIWMCGGQLEIIPCSRVGHIFRKRRPYDAPDGQDTLAYNSLRTAHVWLDNYKKHYLKTRSDLSDMSFGNIDDRINLRRQLKCHSFEWYLQNVYPELLMQLSDNQSNQSSFKSKTVQKNLFNQQKMPKIMSKFLIQLNGTGLCLQAESELSYKNRRLQLDRCSQTVRRQLWKQTVLDEIRIGQKGCLDASQQKMNLVRVQKCHQMGGTQKWVQQKANGSQLLYNVGTGTCLAVRSALNNMNKLNLENIVPRGLSDQTETSNMLPILLPYKIVMSFCNVGHVDVHSPKVASTKEIGPNFFIHWNSIPSKQ